MWSKFLDLIERAKLFFAWLAGYLSGQTVGKLKENKKQSEAEIEIQKAKIAVMAERQKKHAKILEKWRRIRNDRAISNPMLSDDEETTVKLGDSPNDELRLDRD
ncbi:MAG: hypothetical protein SFW66_08930 [Gammaproteobacteria bacterium]|nr:hypothetical protein [Gammaproteobacteria bacterium]